VPIIESVKTIYMRRYVKTEDDKSENTRKMMYINANNSCAYPLQTPTHA